jgi:hypothetical protein
LSSGGRRRRRRKSGLLAADSAGRTTLLVVAVVGVYATTSPWSGAWALGIAHVVRSWDRWDRRVALYVALAGLGALVARPWTAHEVGMTPAGVTGLGLFLAGWWGALAAVHRERRAGEMASQTALRRQLLAAALPVGRVGRVGAGEHRGMFVVVEEGPGGRSWRICVSAEDPRDEVSVRREFWVSEPVDVEEWLGPERLAVRWIEKCSVSMK